MPKTLYHHPNCDTCRKARAWLQGNGVDIALVDLRAGPPDVATLRQAWGASGLPLRRLFNISGGAYREGDWASRWATGVADDEALAALAADGMLLKRPLLVGDGVALVGFDAVAWAAALAAPKD